MLVNSDQWNGASGVWSSTFLDNGVYLKTGCYIYFKHVCLLVTICL